MARQYVAHDLRMRQRNVLRVPRLGREAKADRAVGRQPSRTGFQGPDADFWPLQVLQDSNRAADVTFDGANGVKTPLVVVVSAVAKVQPEHVGTSIEQRTNQFRA